MAVCYDNQNERKNNIHDRNLDEKWKTSYNNDNIIQMQVPSVQFLMFFFLLTIITTILLGVKILYELVSP